MPAQRAPIRIAATVKMISRSGHLRRGGCGGGRLRRFTSSTHARNTGDGSAPSVCGAIRFCGSLAARSIAYVSRPSSPSTITWSAVSRAASNSAAVVACTIFTLRGLQNGKGSSTKRTLPSQRVGILIGALFDGMRTGLRRFGGNKRSRICRLSRIVAGRGMMSVYTEALPMDIDADALVAFPTPPDKADAAHRERELDRRLETLVEIARVVEVRAEMHDGLGRVTSAKNPDGWLGAWEHAKAERLRFVSRILASPAFREFVLGTPALRTLFEEAMPPRPPPRRRQPNFRPPRRRLPEQDHTMGLMPPGPMGRILGR